MRVGIPVIRLTAMILTLVMAGSPGALGAKPSGTGAGGDSSSLSAVSLAVTIYDYDLEGNPYNFQSDGGGDYVDGSQDIKAVIDEYGNFIFDTASGTNATAVRSIYMNFNDPVDPNNTFRPVVDPTRYQHVGTLSDIPLQNLGVDGNPSSTCIKWGMGFSNSDTKYRVSFHKGAEDTAESQTSYVYVTRTSVSPAEWTLTPTGECSPTSNIGALRSSPAKGQTKWTKHGDYYLPFLFILRAK